MLPDPDPARPSSDERRYALRPDCGSCVGLCCVALPFAASSDFAFDKRAGEPCRNLRPDFGCATHSTLREQGFRGCVVFDCFGAGQQVSRVTFGGRDWRRTPAIAGQMFDVFGVMRQLHELLWYLTEALLLEPARSLHDDLERAREDTGRLTYESAGSLLALDLAAHRTRVSALLLRASELVRAGHATGDRSRADLIGADLIGAELKGANLRAASLRGACLIAADLRGADLRMADFTGADLRDADLRGADLTDSIFLTQSQLDSVKGDAETRLPVSLTRPAHWRGSDPSVR